VVADLRGIYTVKDMSDQGFSLDEIREGGVPDHAVQAVDGRPMKRLRAAGYTAKVLRKVGFVLYEIVEGGFTATELKDANYKAAELKEVGFTAGALRVAEFTSKQLHAAKFRLRDMQEGGYPWFDLVIFLKASYAELTHAGYANLDPKHRLFLEYRYIPVSEEDQLPIHDLSILSPRYKVSMMTSPRGSPREHGAHVGHTPLVMRSGCELSSEKLCDVPARTAVEVLELWQGEGAYVRARIRFLSKGWLSSGYKEGWVTSVQQDGTRQLSSAELVAPSRLPPPDFRQRLNDMEA